MRSSPRPARQPQTTEINATARAGTLMKWVYVGLVQAAAFVAVAAVIDAKHRKAILAGGAAAAGVMWMSTSTRCRPGWPAARRAPKAIRRRATMSRAAGRKGTGRDPIAEIVDALGFGGLKPDEETAGEREEQGIGPDREIPGGLNHLGNPPVQRQAVPVPESLWPYYRDDLAHGVEPDGKAYDRDPRLSGGQHGAPPETKITPRQNPVPVYLVEQDGGPGTIRSASPRHITCPASTNAEPARICGKNPYRVEVRLLNEDTATDIRFAQRPSDLTGGGGALLPWPANTYLSLPTQDELYCIGATGAGTPLLSIVEVFDQPEDL